MSRANETIVKEIPQVILDECPLHDGDHWRNETKDVWAAILVATNDREDEFGAGTYPFCWITRGFNTTTVRFQAEDVRNADFPPTNDGFTQALRYAYAQYLFNQE